MAGSATTELIVKLTTPGAEKLPGLGRAFSQFGRDVNKAGLNVKQLSAELKQQESTNLKSINNTKALANSWKELAASVEFGSKEFKEATAEAKRLNAELQKMQGGTKKAGGLGRMARTAGAIAGAGVFGGPEGAIGAAIGGFMPGGGPISAAVGGAIGAQVGMVRQAIGSTAEYSAALARQRKALSLVIGDIQKYNQAQEFLTETSNELAIPQDVITRQFTALTASVTGAGMSVSDAEKVFESIASGIRGTGGSLEDMKAAMVATSQVFSKGKVSAEELRQQLGERLPGAFTIFAESMGKTPAELDKALEQGQVTLDDFMKFSETLFKKYGENAKLLASGPEAAGDRLATAMSSLKDNIGVLLTPIGASFQDTFTGIIKQIDGAAEALRKFLKLGDENLQGRIDMLSVKLEDERKRTEELRNAIESAPTSSSGFNMSTKGTYENMLDANLKNIKILEDEINLLKIKKDQLNRVTTEQDKLGKKGETVYEGLTAGVTKYLTGIKSLGEDIGDAVSNAFKGMEDAIVSFVTTGKASFKDFARSILADMARIYARQLMLKIFSSFMPAAPASAADVTSALTSPGMGGALDIEAGRIRNALGNVYGKNGIVPFAKGGVVSQPTIFPYAKGGIGLMGEAGPEAIMPLKRGSDGRLGVEAKYRGGGGTTVNYTGPTLNFNGDEYVPRSAVGEIIATATSQGAKAGENRTLSTLRNSRSARSRLGM